MCRRIIIFWKDKSKCIPLYRKIDNPREVHIFSKAIDPEVG